MFNRMCIAFLASGVLFLPESQPGNTALTKQNLGLDPLAANNQLSPSEQALGWTQAWNGTSFTGWGIFSATNPASHWSIANGELTTTGTVWDRDLKTLVRYDNFIWSIEWKNTVTNVNSGLIYWSLDTLGAPSFATGLEFQILGKTARYYDSQPRNRAGSCYDIYAASLNAANPDGIYYDATHPEPGGAAVYNHSVIIVNGAQHQYWMNGIKIVEFTVGSTDFNQRKALSKWANGGAYPNWAKFSNGHLVLQNHGAGATYRNIKVKRLPPNATNADIWPGLATAIVPMRHSSGKPNQRNFIEGGFFSRNFWYSLTGKKRSKDQ